ncbi:aminotransferase class I and II [Burkholderia ubonensis]|nr:aminotransferase class I and II [Burkholderia ubonensis]
MTTRKNMGQIEELRAPRNRYRNNDKAIGIGNAFWEATRDAGLAGIVANLDGDGYLKTDDGHRFLNLSCCSYLDLDSHPLVAEGAAAALQRYGVLDHCISRIRIQLPALLELEARLSALFRAKVVTAISASAATAGVLPLVASGHLSGGPKPVMVFDKQCHFSMNLYKPVCGDETLVLTSPHNDMNWLEDVCRKYPNVAYVCDGTYSMGGHAPVHDLLELQRKYGLFLYFDDSHSLSIMGDKGEGYIRSNLGELDERTIIVATLNKAFGTSGAAIMFGPKGPDTALLLERFGGPLAWSQPMNTAAIGASLAVAELHDSPELGVRQRRLQAHIAQFDRRVTTEQSGNGFPIKLVAGHGDKVIAAGQQLYRQGFYVSPVFFPIVPRDQAGLRVMVRAGIDDAEMTRLCEAVASLDLH